VHIFARGGTERGLDGRGTLKNRKRIVPGLCEGGLGLSPDLHDISPQLVSPIRPALLGKIRDTPTAVAILQKIGESLEKASIAVKPMGK
jgi:hypothetical protein